jgi:hypothetical protein
LEGRLTAHVDIKNIGDKLVDDVEFFFVTRDVFGESRITRGTVHGTYSTGTPSALLSNLWPPGDE